MVPSDRLVWLFAAGLLPVLAAAGDPFFLVVGLGWDAVLLSLALADRWAVLPGPEQLELVREVPETAPLARPLPTKLRLTNRSSVTLEVRWREIPPPGFRAEGARGAVVLPPHTRVEREVTLEPLRRGNAQWDRPTVRWRSRLGLVWRQAPLGSGPRVRVHPDPAPRDAREALAMRQARRGMTGLRLALVRGEGREFESLREYRPDDEFRRIDWKATARKGQLIVRQYEAERDQRVVVLLDCGRSMGVRVGDLAKLDRVSEAALRLARVAVESGDRVGLIAFSGRIHAALPPGKGRAQLKALAETLTDLEPDEEEPDYEAAFARLRSMLTRRALVVVLTEVPEREASRPLLASLRAMAPRHLPVVLAMVDAELVAAADIEPSTPEEVFELAVARDLREERRCLMGLLRAQGAYAVQVEPRALSLAAIQRYLDVKARGLL